MKIFKIILLALVVIGLNGCGDPEERVPRHKAHTPCSENPVVSYCGAGCERCHQSPEECLRLVQENLSSFCDNTKQNCYDLWVLYAERCRRVCSDR
ncbi:MAG: hypothetical protein ACK5PQ_00890 [Alphaproteobacteria bacterium]